MISVSGSPYAELPSAFSYRTALNPSCSCGQLGGQLDVAVGEQKPLATAVPALLPAAPGEDPETLANRNGNFVPNALARPLYPRAPEVQGGIRIVGAEDNQPVPVSPVPNDLETSLLWSSQE